MTNFTCDNNIKIDDKNDTCRFCGKNKNEEKFSDKCHAIPQLLGNTAILTKNECDTCNHYYGETIESDLGKFTASIRTFTRVKGKNKIPTYKEGKNKAKFSNGTLYVQNNNMVTFDTKHKKLCFNLKTEKFIPINAYKALVRIALNCLPKEYFNKFNNVNWLKVGERIELNKLYTSIIFSIVPNISQMFNIFLFIRKKGITNVPYCQMVLQSNNIFYQVIIPFLNEDKFLKDVEITVFDFETKNNKKSHINIVDLSPENKGCFKYSINFNYQGIKNIE